MPCCKFNVKCYVTLLPFPIPLQSMLALKQNMARGISTAQISVFIFIIIILLRSISMVNYVLRRMKVVMQWQHSH